jgi:methylmalonyl-CoA mutase
METQYQRSKIQEESLFYESLKHSGAYPIVGVNTFLNQNGKDNYENMQVIRADVQEKNQRLEELKAFKEKNAPKSELALAELKKVALNGGNIFEELLNTVQYATMGEISSLLYEIGGKYRRGM